MTDLLEKALDEVKKLPPSCCRNWRRSSAGAIPSRTPRTSSRSWPRKRWPSIAPARQSRCRLVHSGTTGKFRALYDALPKPIREKARSAYQLWSENPDHPSLRFKKVHARLPVYSVRIYIDWRAVGVSRRRRGRMVLDRLSRRL